MKKIIFFLLMFVGLTSIIQAKTTELFDLDREKLTIEMEQLNKLENFVIQNNNASLAEIMQQNSFLLKNQNSENSLKLTYDDGPLGMSAFALGCCLGPIGLAVLLSSDSASGEEIAQGFFGCVIPSALLGLGIYLGDPVLIATAFEIFVEVWAD